MRTFADQVQATCDSFTIDQVTERLGRQSRASVRDAYKDLATRHRWKYLIKRVQMNLLEPYSEGTVEYDASTGVLTLDDGTFPSWAGSGQILIDRNVYQVQFRTDDTHLVLLAGRRPTEDLDAGTGYQLVQTTYQLPVDYMELRAIVEISRYWQVGYLPPEEFLKQSQTWFNPSEVMWFTITGGKNGRMDMQWSPPPFEARTFDIIYQGRPRPFGLSGVYSAGKATTEEGSTTVTFTDDTVLPANIAGCVFRIGTAETMPEGDTGDNPYLEEHVIAERVSNTELTLETAAATDSEDVLYTIDDPIDVEPVSMLTLLDRMCEHRLNQRLQTEIGRIAFANRQELEAMAAAMQADSRLIPKAMEGGGWRGRWTDIIWGARVT